MKPQTSFLADDNWSFQHTGYVAVFREMSVISQHSKRSRDPEHIPFWGYSIMRGLVLVNVNLHIEFDVPRFTCSKA